MKSRIIVKNLPKKITEERFKTHFSKIGELTEAKLKFTKDGKFRRFGFVGYKTEDEAQKALEYFNNTFIDASKLVVEECKPLNDADKPRAWSKYSKESSKNVDKKQNFKKEEKVKAKESKNEKKDKKIEALLGPLKDDEQFKEFLAANKAIKGKENIWKNDILLNTVGEEVNDVAKAENEAEKNKKSKKVEKKEVKEDEIKDKNEDKTNQEVENKNGSTKEGKKDNDDDEDFENGRLYVRNLCYTCKEEDLEKLFAPYAPIVEVNVPIDSFSKKPKGFAFVTFMFPEKAIKAFNELDGTIFQGRMLHIIPAKSKKEETLDENATFKAKKEAEQKKKAQSGHNWNSLFINQDAVANLMASRYNVDKSELFDVHSSGKKNSSVAVKLAVGETQIVNDMRKFLIRNGVKLDAFNTTDTERSKTVILIKNLANNTKEDELREFFKKNSVNGTIKRFVMPEYGVAALVEFNERQEARDSFKKLAYKKFKNVPIYLEWAPVDVFDGDEKEMTEEIDAEKKEQELTNKETSKKDKNNNKKEESDNEDEYEANATLFVKNLNFDTIEEDLQKVFAKIGKCKATIARKISPNKESLSMGYGFVKYKKASHALEAIKSLQNHKLDGHNLELKFSNRTQTNANGSKATNQHNKSKEPKKKSSKILVRNIPFEAKAKEIEELFRVFGELKYVRLPKKVDGAHRGFGFVDFVTINDAERAFEALSHSTHLFGRRLVLEWAEPEQTQDVEILRMKEEQISSSKSKKLKKSKILDDLGGGEETYNGDKMDID